MNSNHDADESDAGNGAHTGLRVDLVGIGKLELTGVLASHSETTVYRTSRPDILVKLFDLNCGKVDEVSYGPYLNFRLEVENWEDIRSVELLNDCVPGYFGSKIDYENKYAYIAMEYLQGIDLKSWCETVFQGDCHGGVLDEFRETAYHALSILELFHKHGIIVLDFKPDNVIRLDHKRIKFVDLGAFFTPRHYDAMDSYIYSATPDYAEISIDALNLQSGVRPVEASDIFAIGVALFEMVTGMSRLKISSQTANEILSNPTVYSFRDSQIRDLWTLYPHLKTLLPPIASQLRDGEILFGEFWHLLKGYIASVRPDWESLPQAERDQLVLATGTTFITELMPAPLEWLAVPIAQSTTLRSIRLKSVVDVMKLLASPVSAEIQEDLKLHNCFTQCLLDQQHPVEFLNDLNLWDVRPNPQSGHLALAALLACRQMVDGAQFTFLKETHRDQGLNKYFSIVDELEADVSPDGKLTLWQLRNDSLAWIGG